jgi:hypothetical protein
MTPKRKAWRLFVDYRNILKKIPSDFDIKEQAKQCALLDIDNDIEVLLNIYGGLTVNIWMQDEYMNIDEAIEYCKEVKKEIELL